MKLTYFIAALLFFNIGLYAQPEIGKSLTGLKVLKSPGGDKILVNSTEFKPVYLIAFKTIKYSVVLSDEKLIDFISTCDLKFKTPEGYQVGSVFSDIQIKQGILIVDEIRGWGKYVTLSSGWNALFDFKDSVNSTSRIIAFFQRAK